MGMGMETPTDTLFEIPDMPEYPLKALLGMERDMTGVYITGHPLDEVADLLRQSFTTVADVQEMAETEGGGAGYDGLQASMAGILTMAKGKLTRKGSMMGVLEMEDLTGQIEGLVFPKVYEKYATMIVPDELVILEGKLSFREDEDPKLLVDSVRRLDRKNAETHLKPAKELHTEKQSEQARARTARQAAAADAAQPKLTDAQLAKQAARKLYLLLPTRAQMNAVKERCAKHPGDVPVYVKLRDEGIALLMAREYWCNADKELMDGFVGMFGEDGVVLK